MKLEMWNAAGKNVLVHFKDGSEMRGKAQYYTSELDNEEGKASLCIGNVEFTEDEVESITEIEEQIPKSR